MLAPLWRKNPNKGLDRLPGVAVSDAGASLCHDHVHHSASTSCAVTDIRLVAEEEPHQLNVVALCRNEQSRLAEGVRFVDIRAVLKEKADYRGVVGLVRGRQERHLSTIVTGLGEVGRGGGARQHKENRRGVNGP